MDDQMYDDDADLIDQASDDDDEDDMDDDNHHKQQPQQQRPSRNNNNKNRHGGLVDDEPPLQGYTRYVMYLCRWLWVFEGSCARGDSVLTSPFAPFFNLPLLSLLQNGNDWSRRLRNRLQGP